MAVDTNMPFYELPEALVERLLGKTSTLSNQLSNSFKQINSSKDLIRDQLEASGLIQNDSDVIKDEIYPTSCGIDGSYAIEKLLSTDIMAVAGVAIEGLAPPTEVRHWPNPHHRSEVITVSHSISSATVIRAIMICMELDLAVYAPHDVVFLDGSLLSPVIYFNQASAALRNVPKKLERLFLHWLDIGIKAYKKIIFSRREEKIYAALPKYTSRHDLAKFTSPQFQYEDRALLSFLLKGGELVGPIDMSKTKSKFTFYNLPSSLKNQLKLIEIALQKLHVIYYRPCVSYPTLRVEVPDDVKKESRKLSGLLEAIKMQCCYPALMEPYPLYMADRMVKHLSRALPVIRRMTTQEMAMQWEDSLGNIYLAMHTYRTETR
ncbi:MAG: DNA double-strand break repair nuclease NurA [Promethearchaeota archaeon]